MIWILLATYYLGGGFNSVNGSLLTTDIVGQLSKHAETIIDDPARVAAAQQVFRELKKEVKAFEETFSSSGKQLTKSYKDHAADKEQALANLNKLNSDWEAMQLRAIELRFELRNHVTEKEWGEIFESE